MPLFHKKEEKRLPLPEFSRLPELPKYEPEIKMPEIAQIKSAISESRSMPSEIPFRKPLPIKIIEQPQKIVFEEKPLFVKIDKYKEAINKIDQIKAKLREAEIILDELTKIKDKEDNEFNSWRADINDIKQKLLDVDKNLFEV